MTRWHEKRGAVDRARNGLLRTWANLIGWRTSEKLLVIESDDWGSIRTPDAATLTALKSDSYLNAVTRFDALDCLESQPDLELLFDVLSRHSDSQGKAATMTFNTVMGNPDFDAIRDDGFRTFHHEHFLASYERYHGTNMGDIWFAAIEDGLIRPQFHAREHLNSRLWLRDLRDNLPGVRKAFDLGFFGYRGITSSSYQRNYLAAYWCENSSDVSAARKVLDDGLSLFDETFGFRSLSFVPCNYILPLELEQHLGEQGVELIQGQRGQAIPIIEDAGRLSSHRRYTGQIGTSGTRQAVRNVLFEPYMDDTRDWVRSAIHEISQAFLFRRPAIVVSHRINYVSGLSSAHRDRSLLLLDRLLAEVTQRWPDIRFISSDELARAMSPAL